MDPPLPVSDQEKALTEEINLLTEKVKSFHYIITPSASQLEVMVQRRRAVVQLSRLQENNRIEYATIRCTELGYEPMPPELVECSICLEEFEDGKNNMTRMCCCGQQVCFPCSDKMLDMAGSVCEMGMNRPTLDFAEIQARFAEYLRLGQCPFCRSNALDLKDQSEKLLKHAESGERWAQVMVARSKDNDREMAEAVRWYELAAAQGHKEAQLRLSELCLNGCEDAGIPVSLARAIKLAQPLAVEGNARAQFVLAVSMSKAPDENYDDALCWTTVAAQNGFDQAQTDLGRLFLQRGSIEDKCKAIYWLRKAALQNCVTAQTLLPRALSQLKRDCFGMGKIAGHSVIPETMYWLEQQASHAGQDKPQEVLQQLRHDLNKCSHCENRGCKLFKCSRCGYVMYCSKEHQRKDWKAGHKADCFSTEDIQDDAWP